MQGTRIIRWSAAMTAAGLLAASTSAEVINVPEDFPTIQAAIDAASDGDEIVVASGTYREQIDFIGKAILVRSVAGASLTIIDAERAGTTVRFASGEGPNSVLRGFSITGGGGTGQNGGGVFIASSPLIEECIVIDNTAPNGAGVYVDIGNPTLRACAFTDNRANLKGGGIYLNEIEGGMIEACSFSRNAALFQGGGLHVHQVRSADGLEIRACSFSCNTARDGGAAAIGSGLIRILDCDFESNTADGGAGGAITMQGTAVVEDCRFVQNRAVAPSGSIGGGKGGAIYMGGEPTISRCIFDGNIALNLSNRHPNAQGGALHIVDSPSISDCLFVRNEACGLFAHMPSNGGAVYSNAMPDETVRFWNCEFAANRADDYGGAIYARRVLLVNSVLHGNIAKDGSALYADDEAIVVNSRFVANLASGDGTIYNTCDAEITNCEFSGNVANRGAALFNDSGRCESIVIVNATIAQNEALTGTGIYNVESGNGMIVANTIIWGNYAASGNPSIDGPEPPEVQYSDIEGGFGGKGNIEADPLFRDPHGADGVPGTLDDDLRIGVGSACIDAGNNDAVPRDVADVDEDGNTIERTPLDLGLNPRFVDDVTTEDSGFGQPPIVDMGAYEFQACPADLDDSGAVDIGDLIAILTAWGNKGGPEDLDGSGVVDFGDLIIVLAAWGPCE